MKKFRFTRLMAIEEGMASDDGYGGQIYQWMELGKHWVSLRPFSGSERPFAGADISLARYKITLRAAPEGSQMRPKPNQRFREGERLFLIETVADLDADGRFIECRVREEVLS